MAVWLSPAGLFNELAEELILKLGVGQTHLQSTLGQGDMVVDGRSIDGHVDEKLTGLRRDDSSIEFKRQTQEGRLSVLVIYPQNILS